tara:strand:- start:14 stop:373 length:360 start_codon:yes stop_codon:yes gene_type:complete
VEVVEVPTTNKVVLVHQVVVRVETEIKAGELAQDHLIQEHRMQMFPLHHFLHLPHGLVILVVKDHHKQMEINLAVAVVVPLQQEVEVKKMDLVLVVMEQFILLSTAIMQNMVLVVAVEE